MRLFFNQEPNDVTCQNIRKQKLSSVQVGTITVDNMKENSSVRGKKVQHCPEIMSYDFSENFECNESKNQTIKNNRGKQISVFEDRGYYTSNCLSIYSEIDEWTKLVQSRRQKRLNTEMRVEGMDI